MPSQYCIQDIDYTEQCCQELEAADVRQIVLVNPNYKTTLKTALDAATNQAQLDAAMATAYTLGKIKIIKKVSGKYDAKDTEQKGYGDVVSVVSNTEHTVGIMTPNVKLNGAWIDNQKYGAKKWVVCFCTENFMWFPDAEASMNKGTLVVSDNKQDHAKYDIEWKWTKQFTPVPYLRSNFLFSCDPYLDVQFVDRAGLDLEFHADFLLPCVGAGGSLTITNILRDAVNVTGSFTITPSLITVGEVEDTYLISLPGGYLPGNYTFTFTLTGCGNANPVTFSVTIYIS